MSEEADDWLQRVSRQHDAWIASGGPLRPLPQVSEMQAAIPRHVRRRLPKAGLLHFEWAPAVLRGRPLLQRNRLANAIRWRIGSLAVTHRAPWLPDVARATHPHLFRSPTP